MNKELCREELRLKEQEPFRRRREAVLGSGSDCWVVLGWVESYQISGALHLGGLDVLEEGVGVGWRGTRRREPKSNQAKIFIDNKSKHKKLQTSETYGWMDGWMDGHDMNMNACRGVKIMYLNTDLRSSGV